jgi:signal transduction histidine kinase
MVRDITARKQREAELRHSQRMEAVGQLTGGVAHDFNNLLAVIMGNLEMAEERVGGDAETATLLANASRAAYRSAALTQRLLAYSRKQILKLEDINLDALVADMAELLRRALGETIVVDVRSTDGLWDCVSDRPQLETALLNTLPSTPVTQCPAAAR